MKKNKEWIKKLLLAVLGIAFALAFTACDDQDQKLNQSKNADKEKHHRRW